jgi:hypothetical protein
VWGMPARRRGRLAHAVLPIGGMGDAIVRRVAQGRTRVRAPGGAPRGPRAPPSRGVGRRDHHDDPAAFGYFASSCSPAPRSCSSREGGVPPGVAPRPARARERPRTLDDLDAKMRAASTGRMHRDAWRETTNETRASPRQPTPSTPSARSRSPRSIARTAGARKKVTAGACGGSRAGASVQRRDAPARALPELRRTGSSPSSPPTLSTAVLVRARAGRYIASSGSEPRGLPGAA